jgi:hypothetical protein
VSWANTPFAATTPIETATIIRHIMIVSFVLPGHSSSIICRTPQLPCQSTYVFFQ